MRIGIDARNLVTRLTGIGRYVLRFSQHLVEAGHDVRLYLPEPPGNDLGEAGAATVEVAAYRGALPRTVWGQTVLPRLARRDAVDVFWGPAHRLPPGLPGSMPRVLTVHDLVWLKAPQTMHARTLVGEKLFFARSLRKAHVICADSAATATDIREAFPGLTCPVVTVYPGADSLPARSGEAVLERYGIDRPFALFVGTLEPRKNLARLLEAYARLRPEARSRCMLVIAGGRGWESSTLSAPARKGEGQSGVRFLDYVGDDDLAVLYRACRFLVLPSLYEGFGLPIVEANACGAPVLTSNLSCMPEVAGEAAVYVDPLDVGSIADGFARLALDDGLHAGLAGRARANAARFDWRRSTQQLVAAFQEAARLRGKA